VRVVELRLLETKGYAMTATEDDLSSGYNLKIVVDIFD